MPENDSLNKDNLSEDEKSVLDQLLDVTIPASADGKMPSAAEIGFDKYLCAHNMIPGLREILKLLQYQAQQSKGAEFLLLTADDKIEVVAAARRENLRIFATFTEMVTQCYYLNAWVIKAIGQDVRPPFPKGYQLEEGDLCLLEPVYERGSIYRA
jgi:hypothetical protein